jgi:hypothetical protein
MNWKQEIYITLLKEKFTDKDNWDWGPMAKSTSQNNGRVRAMYQGVTLPFGSPTYSEILLRSIERTAFQYKSRSLGCDAV